MDNLYVMVCLLIRSTGSNEFTILHNNSYTDTTIRPHNTNLEKASLASSLKKDRLQNINSKLPMFTWTGTSHTSITYLFPTHRHVLSDHLTKLLKVPKTKTSSYSDRTFMNVAHRVVESPPSLSQIL